ncbi:hypothetical protein [Halochromatium roseum]|uniref:hypothetical protein n=1 Tax=Halochromatium roseum TaxID=391920 RepID=UPI0019114C27|nr:hypothetical protein [Halochromatium roseum]MBK5938873.1 hypothetical protein [Halochromatium roseum]
MKVRDKTIGETVDVYDRHCLRRPCYWPRSDPGAFTQGQGYQQRSGGDRGYLCGNREIRGCPDPLPDPSAKPE